MPFQFYHACSVLVPGSLRMRVLILRLNRVDEYQLLVPCNHVSVLKVAMHVTTSGSPPLVICRNAAAWRLPPWATPIYGWQEVGQAYFPMLDSGPTPAGAVVIGSIRQSWMLRASPPNGITASPPPSSSKGHAVAGGRGCRRAACKPASRRQALKTLESACIAGPSERVASCTRAPHSRGAGHTTVRKYSRTFVAIYLPQVGPVRRIPALRSASVKCHG